MNLREIGEFGFIEELKKIYQSNNFDIIKGIGDDCAVFINEKNTAVLLTTDMLVENVHFEISTLSPKELGFKSLSVNLSDIAAMGGIPKNVLVSLAIPEKIDYEFLKDFYYGMDELINEYDLNLIGGDTNFSRSDLIINIVMTGEVEKDEVIYRNGAKINDKIFVTGYLGDSSLGLDVCLRKLKLDKYNENYFRNVHIKPKAQIKEGSVIAKSKLVNSMIDISDGLASDLMHICCQSGVGAVIFENQIPYSEFMKNVFNQKNINPLDYALYGGEDFCLLFTVSPENKKKLCEIFQSHVNTNLFEIGEVIQGNRIELVDKSGDRKVLSKSGYRHF